MTLIGNVAKHRLDMDMQFSRVVMTSLVLLSFLFCASSLWSTKIPDLSEITWIIFPWGGGGIILSAEIYFGHKVNELELWIASLTT